MKNNYKYKWKYNDEERPRGYCYDCGLNYNEFPDMIIPDELWEGYYEKCAECKEYVYADYIVEESGRCEDCKLNAKENIN